MQLQYTSIAMESNLLSVRFSVTILPCKHRDYLSCGNQLVRQAEYIVLFLTITSFLAFPLSNWHVASFLIWNLVKMTWKSELYYYHFVTRVLWNISLALYWFCFDNYPTYIYSLVFLYGTYIKLSKILETLHIVLVITSCKTGSTGGSQRCK